MKIVVLESDATGSVSYSPLSEFGELVTYRHTPDDLIAQRISDADIVVANKCIMNEASMKEASSLKLLCEAATGYNNIDLSYCKLRGIVVTNARGYSTESVVQHTFAMLFHVLEKLEYYSDYVSSGEYSEQSSFTHLDVDFHELYGKRFGVMGLGAIGRRVAEVATSFGMEVVYYSASGNTYDVPYKAVSFDELLTSCDVISCHAPLNDKTRGTFDKDAFAKMKPTAVFLNLGRGPIVVEADLAWALEAGEISAAALDVYEVEPLPADSPLMRLAKGAESKREDSPEAAGKRIKPSDRLFLTPHIAWGTIEARERLIADVAESIRAWLAGKPRSVVEM